jgi:hypothetical protein
MMKQKKLLQDLMNAVSSRRLQFTTYLAGYVASDTLEIYDEKLAESYLSGIDDANRIILSFLEGKEVKLSNFKKAEVHKPSDYGVGNMTEEQRNDLNLSSLSGEQEPLKYFKNVKEALTSNPQDS